MKNKFYKKLLIVMVTLGMALVMLSGCSKKNNETSVSSIKDKGTLTIGMINSNPPYEFQNSDNVVQGADIPLIKKVAKELGVKYKIKTMDFDGLLPALQGNKVDMLITAMSPTPERKQGAKFSKVYYRSTNTLLVRKSEAKKYENTKNFANATIAVVNNSTQEEMLKKLYPKAKYKKLSKVTDLALAVNNGKADACSIDVPTATILARKNPKLQITSFRHKDSSLGAAIAMPKNASPDLVKTVNKVVTENKAEYAQWVIDYAKKVK
ncbi:transporter substrate-binding domain-containing protein [Lactobacillus sp. ESL0681]|uniref:transporter substrate-binding domain-containing protein n=1 Tax=Lactobacillus sp. ESL0681 TaxID=2983211 RepID=UPI0023F65B33|nr:transporter substrate-binding domain-containing protein [Lactobacillus sp. ESL0681]WEV40048.1 transporter substrate-binding domain-containing protein [Lactobacillus sp. ESL0681]